MSEWGIIEKLRFYFALFDDGLTVKTLELAFIGFCIQSIAHVDRTALTTCR